MNVKDLDVYGDSIMITSQSTGEWEKKIPELVKYEGYFARLSTQYLSTICHAQIINFLMP